MELPFQPSTDPIPATPLLHPDEFRALATHIYRAESRFNGAVGVAVIGSLVATIVTALGSIWVGYPIAIVSWTVTIFGLTLMYQWATFGAQKYHKHTESLIQFLADMQDADMLGPLLDLKVSHDGSREISKRMDPAIDAAVLRLLPLVQTAHGDPLNSRHRERITFYWHAGTPWLVGTKNLDQLHYRRGILHAMEQIGDMNDLPWLKSLEGRVNLSRELTAAILRCIDIVEERVARAEGKEFLLRSGDNPDAAGTLLRPITERADSPSDQLLRAADEQARPPREDPSSSDFQS
ncbi:MAG: hypothetical protein JWL77_4584 [Chthonomonadaceae bacterium]|nr:hypothetical protein [Chthonomonadaceae bacterium]